MLKMKSKESFLNSLLMLFVINVNRCTPHIIMKKVDTIINQMDKFGFRVALLFCSSVC
jgi:hypothetical protein